MIAKFAALSRMANEAKSFEDLSRLDATIAAHPRLTKSERIVLERAIANRLGYLAKIARTA